MLPSYVPQAEDHFAYTLAAGDFNGDGADDLATGIPFDDCLADVGPVNCGSVVVRYGVPGAGLATGLADQILNQQESGSPDPAEAEDFFGWALAACDFDFDGFDDLAVGVPREDLTLGGTLTIVDSGIVEIYYGTSAGLASPASAVLKSNGIESGQQRLGEALACGDFDSDGFDDLVVGLPGRHRRRGTLVPDGFSSIPGRRRESARGRSGSTRTARGCRAKPRPATPSARRSPSATSTTTASTTSRSASRARTTTPAPCTGSSGDRRRHHHRRSASSSSRTRSADLPKPGTSSATPSRWATSTTTATTTSPSACPSRTWEPCTDTGNVGVVYGQHVVRPPLRPQPGLRPGRPPRGRQLRERRRVRLALSRAATSTATATTTSRSAIRSRPTRDWPTGR